MTKCMQCHEQEAVFSNDQGDHHICQDCSDMNLTAHLFGAAKDGMAVLKMDDTKPAEQVPFYVHPPEVA